VIRFFFLGFGKFVSVDNELNTFNLTYIPLSCIPLYIREPLNLHTNKTHEYHEENVSDYGTLFPFRIAAGREGGPYPQSGPHVLVGWHDESRTADSALRRPPGG
jgi:hypothetical protein